MEGKAEGTKGDETTRKDGEVKGWKREGKGRGKQGVDGSQTRGSERRGREARGEGRKEKRESLEEWEGEKEEEREAGEQ